jgi:ribosomal protein L13E
MPARRMATAEATRLVRRGRGWSMGSLLNGMEIRGCGLRIRVAERRRNSELAPADVLKNAFQMLYNFRDG